MTGGLGAVCLQPHHRRQSISELAGRLELVLIIGLPDELDQDGALYAVAIHLKEQALDWLAPDRRRMTVAVHNHHVSQTPLYP